MFAMQREEVIVQLQLHFAHGLLDLFGCLLAFPNDDHLPAVFLKQLVVLLVPLLVATNLIDPKLPIGCWNLATSGVSMPEAPVDEDCRAIFTHHDVGLPWDALHVEPIAVTMLPQPLPHLQFGFGAFAVDVRHAAMSLFWSHFISHGRRLF